MEIAFYLCVMIVVGSVEMNFEYFDQLVYE
jgi:hypothetical protein